LGIFLESKLGIDIYEVAVIHGKSNLIFEAIFAFKTNFPRDIFLTSQFSAEK